MPITFSCHCGKTLQVADLAAGKKARCPQCGAVVPVPEAEVGIVTPQMVRSTKAPPPLPLTVADEDESLDLDPEEVGSRDGRAKAPAVPAVDQGPPMPAPGEIPEFNHAGLPLSPRAEFFIDPPVELGSLYSAECSLMKGVKPMDPAMRWALIFFVTVVGIALGAGIALAFRPVHPLMLAAILGSIGGLLGFLIVFFSTRFSHTCTFVGREGVANYHCTGSTDNFSENLFLFANAVELRIAQTRHYTNGIYTGTNYSFTWSDDSGGPVFTIAGGHKSEKGEPPPNDYFHYALAAEGAWSDYLARNIDLIMGRDESLYFGLDGKNFVRVGRDFLEISMKGNAARLFAEDIDYVQIQDGMVSIWERGGKRGWFSKKGIHDFAFASLGNARFFLFAVERMLGIPIR
ncbi:MAG: hypothetical protein K2X38_25210 [Gemmataceae bacterium]|nr:hypothetical protein [Gemmataceae bacterium]